MMATLRSYIEKLMRVGEFKNAQSSHINGDGNTVNQEITNYYVIEKDIRDKHEVNRADTTELPFIREVTNQKNNPIIKRALTGDTITKASRQSEIPITAFLAGPYIEPSDENCLHGSPAESLRFQLFHRLMAEEYKVSLGSYQDLLETFQSGNGQHLNATEAELSHAKYDASIIIMIPDSPGSFAEFGTFSLEKDICSKMIILANSAHQSSACYLNTGPIHCARTFGSRIEHVDYEDIDGCYGIVSDFSSKIRDQVLLERRLKG